MDQRRRSGKLPIVLSVTALLVAVLGFTPVGEAGRNLVFPKNSIGSKQLKAGGVKRVDIAANAINSSKIADGSVGSSDISDGSLGSVDIAAGVIPAAFSGSTAGGDLAGTYPSPTIKDGAVTTADLAVTPTVRLTATADQSIPNGAGAFTPIVFTSEVFDSASLHDNATNNSRITITTPGVYLVGANLTWNPNGTGAREVSLRKNGATFLARVVQQGDAVNTTDQQPTTLVKLVAGDFIEVVVRQTSGAALGVLAVGTTEHSPIFWATWVGPAPA